MLLLALNEATIGDIVIVVVAVNAVVPITDICYLILLVHVPVLFLRIGIRGGSPNI